MKLIAKTRQEVADEYAITVRTLYRWLKRNNICPPQGRLTPLYLDLIYKTFGKPILIDGHAKKL
jgi:hypothetical protein